MSPRAAVISYSRLLVDSLWAHSQQPALPWILLPISEGLHRPCGTGPKRQWPRTTCRKARAANGVMELKESRQQCYEVLGRIVIVVLKEDVPCLAKELSGNHNTAAVQSEGKITLYAQ